MCYTHHIHTLGNTRQSYVYRQGILNSWRTMIHSPISSYGYMSLFEILILFLFLEQEQPVWSFHFVKFNFLFLSPSKVKNIHLRIILNIPRERHDQS